MNSPYKGGNKSGKYQKGSKFRHREKGWKNHCKGKGKLCQRVKPMNETIGWNEERPIETHTTYLTLKQKAGEEMILSRKPDL